MFSASVEMLLSVAYREAVARRHAHLTAEHLLYVLAHDVEGEKILARPAASISGSCAPTSIAYLQKNVEQFGRGTEREPEQTLGVPARAPDRRAPRAELGQGRGGGRRPARGAAAAAEVLRGAGCSSRQGVTRLDILNYISHGVTKVPMTPDDEEAPSPGATEGVGSEGPVHRTRSTQRLHHEPVGARQRRAARSNHRAGDGAAADARDPLPPAQEQSGVRRRPRRRQDGDG